MADKTVIHETTHTATANDPVYSIAEIAENVRRVEDRAGEDTDRVKKAKAAKSKPARQRKAAAAVKTKMKVPAKKAAVEKPVPSMAVSKKEERKKQAKNTTQPASKENKQENNEKSESGDEEFIEIKSDLFWKISTVVLAILVIWSYFFR